MNFKALRSGVVACTFAVVLTSSAGAESLGEAVDRAVKFMPEVQAANARRGVAEAQTGQARAELYPSINAALGGGRETSRNRVTQPSGSDVTLTRREADLSISQLLFDGGASFGQVKRFNARAQGAALNVSDAAETTALRAGQTYIDVHRLREQLAIALENVATHEHTLADVNALAEAGRGRRADVTQAEARRALALSSAEQLRNQLMQSEAAYRYVTGRPPSSLEPPPNLAVKLPVSLEQAISVATAVHPAILSAQKDLEAAQYDRESARTQLAVPRVTVELGASRNRDIDGLIGPNNDRYAMLRLRYNLFRGFGDSERVRETEARIDEALAGLDRVRNEVARDVQQSWDALISDRTRLRQLDQYAQASASVAEAYRLQFQLGQRSLLDVLNAENESFNAAASYIAGRSAVSVDEIRLLASLGRLLESLGIEAQPRAVAGTIR